jgi:short-subunit dehydrogenase
MRRLNGRIAVVTGAGSGIGRAVAGALAGKGCNLALLDIDEDKLAGTAKLVEAQGRRSSRHVVDVSDRACMQQLPDDVLREHGAIHILINNAGVVVSGTLEEQSFEDLDWIVGTNFWGVVHGCKFFLPYLRKADEAHILNLSSLLGLMGTPRHSSYCATKFAVRALSESLAAELVGTNIGVTCAYAGRVRTNIVAASRFADEGKRQRTQRKFDRHGIAPDVVAHKIVRAIERGQTRVLIGLDTRGVEWIKRMAPDLTDRLIARVYRKRNPS